MTDPKPVGKPYSQVYEPHGKAMEDSKRLRRRLGYFISDASHRSRSCITQSLRVNMGWRIHDSNINENFRDCTLIDLLNSIQRVWLPLSEISGSDVMRPSHWIAFVRTAFKEENVAYTVDECGGVHPAFDEQFDMVRHSTIAALDTPRYATARQFFDDAIADMKQPRDTRDAVRKTFEAVENVAKLMVPKIARLGAAEVQKALKPIATGRLEGIERDTTNRMIESFAEWVNACQQYRHAPGAEEPEPPSLDLAIWMVSTGAAHLRWLVGVDQASVNT
jgi:hypothetical protein